MFRLEGFHLLKSQVLLLYNLKVLHKLLLMRLILQGKKLRKCESYCSREGNFHDFKAIPLVNITMY